MRIAEIQQALREAGLDGWLFFDHHHRDPLAYRVLQLKSEHGPTRRWYYMVPAFGDPMRLVHRIESGVLDGLPGEKIRYSGWSEQTGGLSRLLAGKKRIAMQYSPRCAVPYVAMVDAGTIELVRSLGAEVVTSADLVQYFEARWNAEKLASHLEAGRRVDQVLRAAFAFIGERQRNGVAVNEADVKDLIRAGFDAAGMETDHGPIVGVNAHASDPHYEPFPETAWEIKRGDWVLIDLWAKLRQPGSVYYDITWTGYCGDAVPERHQRVFDVVRGARDAAVARVTSAIASGEALHGFDVDDAARGFIGGHGFGEYFFHRTGHSIGEEVHGSGANMDNLETHDERRIIPWTCFSVEPGIYLPEFGVRSEVNLFIGEDGARVTGAIQTEPVRVG